MPVFRGDLEVSTGMDKDGAAEYIIRNPSTGDVFEIGEEEYFLCTLFDGNSTAAGIKSRFEERFDLHLDKRQLKVFIRRIGEAGLFTGTVEIKKNLFDLFGFKSPWLWKRWRIFNPGGFCEWAARPLWWLFTTPFVAFSVFLFILAAGVVFNNWNAVVRDVEHLVIPLPVLAAFAAAYAFNNVPGEIIRGIASARFGGRPNEFGVWLAYDVMPRFYCKSRVEDIVGKSRREWVLFTPAYYSLFSASAGIILWKITPPSVSLHVFGLLIAAIGVTDAMLRLNILWPMEAYYLASNWFSIKDFRKRAISAAGAWICRRPMPEPLAEKEKRLFIIYGLLTSAATFPSLAVAGYFLGSALISGLAGTGALIFMAAVLVKYRKPLAYLLKRQKAVDDMAEHSEGEGANRWKKTLLRAGGGGVAALVMLIPYPYEPSGAFKFLPLKNIELHTNVGGEIKQVLVKEGDFVKKGDILGLLDTREQRTELEATTADLDKARHDLLKLEAGAKPEEIEKTKRELDDARTRYQYSSREVKRLKALYDGKVISEEEYDKAEKTAALDAKKVEVAEADLELVKSGHYKEDIDAQRAVVRNLETKVRYKQENVVLAKLLSPISGQIATPYMDTKVGQILKKDDLFLLVQDTRNIQAEIQIPESDIGDVRNGGRAKIRLWAEPLKVYYGYVISIAPKADTLPDGSNIVRVVVEIPNTDYMLRPSMTGAAKVSGGSKPLIIAFTRPLVRFFVVEVWSWLP